MPTTANPYIDPLEVEAAKRELPRLVFAQEYEAAFVTEFGARFKSPQRYEPEALPTEGFREATGCDFAYTSKAGDWTVFIEGRIAGDTIYLTNAYRQQTEVDVWIAALRLQPNPFAYIGGQEKGITQLLGRYGVNVKTAPATADKLARAQPVIAAWNRGNVQVPREAPWLDDVLPEVLAFTGDPRIDPHDDAIDALSSLHHTLAGRPQPRIRGLG
jgi:predicted phage terminase large subunit-like protein